MSINSRLIVLLMLLLSCLMAYGQQWPISQADEPMWDRINGTFGEIHPTNGAHFHGAIDIETTTLNCPVRTIQNGRIQQTGTQSIVVEHVYPANTTNYHRRTKYLHINPNSNLSVGTIVTQGDQITTVVNSTGVPGTSDHLHFEMFQFDNGSWYKINPLGNEMGWEFASPTDNSDPEINDVYLMPLVQANNVASGFSIYQNGGALTNQTTHVKVHFANRPGSNGSTFDYSTNKLTVFGNIGSIAGVRDVSINNPAGEGVGLTVHKMKFKIDNRLKYDIYFDKVTEAEDNFIERVFHTDWGVNNFGNEDYIDLYSDDGNYVSPIKSIENQRSNGIWFTKARTGTPWIFATTPVNTARYPSEALYSDGEHTLTYEAQDAALRSVTEDLKVIVDNFRPYVKEVFVRTFGEGGLLLYHGKVIWNNSTSTLSIEKSAPASALQVDQLYIKVIFSEPVKDAEINLEVEDGSSYRLMNGNNAGTEFTIFYVPGIQLGHHALKFKAKDFAGNPLQSNPTQIPVRQANGNWTGVTTTEIDDNHYVKVNTSICNNGGRQKSGQRASSECLFADFSIDNSNIQANESIVISPIISGSGLLTYSWSFGDGAIPSTSTASTPQTVIYTSSGGKTVSLQICDALSNCITETKTNFITVSSSQIPASLAVDFSSNYYSASINEPFLLASNVTGSTGSITYNWNFGEGAIGDGGIANPEVRYSTPGNKSITLTVHDSYTNATKTRTSLLYVTAPYFSISPSINGCGPTTSSGLINLSAISTTGGNGYPYNSYTWDFGDGKSETTSTPYIAHTYQSGGKYTVRLKVCDETGCGTAESINCVVVPTTFHDVGTLAPKFRVNGQLFGTQPIIVGLNTPVTFTDATTCNADPATFNYRWRIDCDYAMQNCREGVSSIGPIPYEYVFTSLGPKGVQLRVEINQPHQIATHPYAEGYAVQVVTNAGPGRCYAEIGEVTVSSTCYDPSNKPVFSIPVARSNCPVALKTSVDMAGNVEYVNNVVDLGNLQYNHPVTFPYTADFGFAVFQWDGVKHNIIGSRIQRFTFYGPVEANAAIDQQVCLGSNVSIGSPPIEGNTYVWTGLGASPSAFLSDINVANPVFNGVQKGTFKYKVTATSIQTGCSKSDEITIVVDQPVVKDGSFYTKLGVPITLNVDVSGGFGNNFYSWSPGTYLNSSTSATPSFSSVIEGDYNYSILVTDQRGCKGSAMVIANASSAPGNLIATAEAYSRIKLAWIDRSNNESGFVIHRSINGGSDFVPIATLTANTTSFNDLNVVATNTYYYKATAIINNSASAFSNVASVSTSLLPEFSFVIPSLVGLPSKLRTYGDINNDGVMEVICDGPAGELIIYSTLGGQFAPLHTVTVPGATGWAHDVDGFVHGVHLLDLDNDNDLDIITIHKTIAIYRNNGASFAFVSDLETIPNGNAEICYIDYDGDNDIDCLTRNTLYSNNGNLTFTPVNSTFNAVNTFGSVGQASVSADFDNDGDSDILRGEDPYVNGSKIRIYDNENGVFNNFRYISQEGNASSVDIADFDKNGRLDILRHGRILANHQNGFSELNSGPIGRTAAWGDYNFDNQMDFNVGYLNAKVAIFKNQNNNFIQSTYPTPTGGWPYRKDIIGWIDADSDGDLDLISHSEIYRNNLGTNLYRNNQRPSSPSNLCVYFNKNKATFTWSPATDGETLSTGLTYNLYVKHGDRFLMTPLANIDNGFRKVVAMGNVSQNTSWTITVSGKGSLEWGVQAIDNQFIGSLFAKNTFQVTQPACGSITFTTSIVGTRDIIAPYLCNPNSIIVSSGATLTLEAPNEIKLMPGFRVELGSSLKARLISYTAEQNPCINSDPGGRDHEHENEFEKDSKEFINVYPNPNIGDFMIEATFESGVENLEIHIVSLNGSEVFFRKYSGVDSISQQVNINHLARGIYIVKISADGRITYKKIVKF